MTTNNTTAAAAYETAVARYFEAWNAHGTENLTRAVAAAWTEDGSYTDPLADVSGHEGIAAVINGAREQFPGFEFRRTGTVDGHHDIARFTWELVSSADGSAPVAGFDVITLAEDGRIRTVHGFLDRVPTA
ncbi:MULTISPECIES: nuclear transport factor 2 family protein [unclassified Streptomyces]|uniref:nuclear transport factor 2 family protein n=1 Tax=unclassified Streptomyces TaxID=2593676 RepID=UPI00136E2043|nr:MULTISPECIES: nuclear transport factor 2 family protein [unclassified Streptomyces]NEA03462.1 nuclear transport factor 2 family protein [Streptomyces sp. SID10116]MYY83884.1 nuclear transport factor 2 family protein [Streptomyces sp. SID335]MYZ17181.1 nuclear transport factor 2 family protein [Streptomyces sp. SID337]NDZ84087.1 nuclear transport factor 2 family protein [Streptomyces sp. SID10115]NEB44704.1 nuclear transport factor 2 family protein [Streptomyces sp. SID339]